MAPKSKSVTVELSNPQPKKHVVRFDATDDDAAVGNIYISKLALSKLGDPEALTLTIEAS